MDGVAGGFVGRIGIATIQLRNGSVRKAEIHWYEAHGIGRKEYKRKRYLDKLMKTTKTKSHFVVCVDNSEYPASLELHKIYRLIPDRQARADGDMRVIDESGEDYLFPADYFIPIDLPRTVVRAPLNYFVIY